MIPEAAIAFAADLMGRPAGTVERRVGEQVWPAVSGRHRDDVVAVLDTLRLGAAPGTRAEELAYDLRLVLDEVEPRRWAKAREIPMGVRVRPAGMPTSGFYWVRHLEAMSRYVNGAYDGAEFLGVVDRGNSGGYVEVLP